MKPNRTGEQGSIPERQERFFQREEYWYYTTREGVDIGPFDSMEDAANGAEEFIDFIQYAAPDVIETLEQCGGRAVA